MTSPSPRKERRHFFRVQDQVFLQLEQKSTPQTSGTAHMIYPYINALRKIDVETKHAWYQLQNSDPHIAGYLQALNRKIDCLAQALLASQNDAVPESNQLMQLSEGGFGGDFDFPYIVGSQYQATLVLFPQRHTLLCTAQCIHCAALPAVTSNTQRYRVGFAFMQINEGDAQVLARHIFTVQSNQRRQQQEKQSAHGHLNADTSRLTDP